MSVNYYLAENNASVENYILYVNSTNPGGISAEVDPFWTANWTSYYTSAEVDVEIAGIGNWSADSGNYYTSTEVDDINDSMKNYVDDTFTTEAYVDTEVASVGNWSADSGNYYTSSEVDDENSSQTNYIGENNLSVNYYLAENNASVNNYIIYVNSTNPGGISAESDPMWTANWTSYYTSTEVDAINTSVYNFIINVNTSTTNYILENNASIENTMVPYTGADKNVNISFNNFSIGGLTIWWNGTHGIMT